MTAIERLEAQIAGLTNLARDYEAEWKARRMAVHVLSNALSELRDADPAPDCERCDEAVNRDVGHIAEKLGCEATVEAVEAAVERLIEGHRMAAKHASNYAKERARIVDALGINGEATGDESADAESIDEILDEIRYLKKRRDVLDRIVEAFGRKPPPTTVRAVKLIKRFRRCDDALRTIAKRLNINDEIAPEKILAGVVHEFERLLPRDESENVRWPGVSASPTVPPREERTGHGFIEGPGVVVEGDSGDATAARERVADVVRDGDIGAARRALDTGWRRGTDEGES